MQATLPIIRELTTFGEGLMWIVGPGDMVSENASRGIQEPEVSGSSITIKADNWHFHLDEGRVGGIQFVETYGDLSSHYIRFADLEGETLLRAYIPAYIPAYIYGEQDSASSGENSRFDDMRSRYEGVKGVEYVRREVLMSSFTQA